MSMSRLPQGRGEVGEAIAGFSTYEAAQKAVSSLIAADVPARDIAIVGTGLHSVERVTGRLGYAAAARSGAMNGLLLGLFFSAIFVLGTPTASISAFVGVLFVGVALGMLLSLGAYAIVRRRRDFASVMQVIADHYDVTVLPSSIHRAREILGQRAGSGASAGSRTATVYGRPSHTPGAHTGRRPDDAGRRGAGPAAAPADDTPPRYGERLPAAQGGERLAPPQYGVRVDPESGEPESGEPESGEPGDVGEAAASDAQSTETDAQTDPETETEPVEPAAEPDAHDGEPERPSDSGSADQPEEGREH